VIIVPLASVGLGAGPRLRRCRLALDLRHRVRRRRVAAGVLIVPKGEIGASMAVQRSVRARLLGVCMAVVVELACGGHLISFGVQRSLPNVR